MITMTSGDGELSFFDSETETRITLTSPKADDEQVIVAISRLLLGISVWLEFPVREVLKIVEDEYEGLEITSHSNLHTLQQLMGDKNDDDTQQDEGDLL